VSNKVYYIGPAKTIDEALARLITHDTFLSCDTETVTTKDRRIIGLGFGLSRTEAIYFTMFEDENHAHGRSPHWQTAVAVLKNRVPKWLFNASFDLDVIEPIAGEIDAWEDPSMMGRIQALPNSLELVAGLLWAEVHQTIQQILPKGKTMLDLTPEAVAFKCLNDCMSTWHMVDLMRGPEWLTAEDSGNLYWKDEVLGKEYDVTPKMRKAYKLDRAMIPLLRRMGKKGIGLSYERLIAHYEKLAAEKFRYQAICEQMFGFNPGSNQQTGYVLAKRGNILPFTQPRGWKQLKVDEDQLLKLDDPLARIVLEYRWRADQLSDVIEPWLGKPKGAAGQKIPYKEWKFPERVYTHWRLDLATSRLASYEDNLQNKTPSLRDCLAPDNGVFTWWDLSQIEMRLFAHFSQDPLLLDAYANDKSIHLMTMDELWPGLWRYRCCRAHKCSCGQMDEVREYTDSKTFNFAMIYLAMAVALSKQTRRPVDVCEDLSQRWLNLYHVGHSWMLEQGAAGIERGYVETLEGRRCLIPDITERGSEERPEAGIHHSMVCGINYLIQGTAAWPIKVAMLRSDSDGLDQRLQVHDEVVIDGDVKEWTTGLHKTGPFAELLPGIVTPYEVYKSPVWR
jgi:DNA polymerase-1